MTSSAPSASPPLPTAGTLPRWAVWLGRILSAFVGLGLGASAVMKLVRPPQLVENFVNHLGYPAGALTGIGILELFCVLVYAIPRTAVIGAVLITGYLGGAIATHVRVGDGIVAPLALGVVAWVGLLLRDGRLRALLPFAKM